ncbi:Tripartite tricarboxylate transporter family receptor [compost metagenome]
MPSVPTVAESGYPGFEAISWQAVLAPAGTPQAVVDALSKGIAEVVSVPEVKRQLAGYGYEVVGSTPGDFGAHIERELVAWKRAVEVSGAKVN